MEQINMEKKRVFSGITPSGRIHLGNFVGAISLWLKNQHKYENLFCVVDLHSITNPESIDPNKLRQRIREATALFISCGIDPNESIIFVQSQISAHAELGWILNCITPLGWLEKTYYNTKAEREYKVGTEMLDSVGLFDYPVLMAADILLYDVDVVQSGKDQKQNIEMAGDIAKRFNSFFGYTFKIPGPLVNSGEAIMSFDNPTIKMTKSIAAIRQGHAIMILDSPDVIRMTIRNASTDEINEIDYDNISAGVKNLLILYEVFTYQKRDEVRKYFEGKKCEYLKNETAEAIISGLEPIQRKYREINEDKNYLDGILKKGKEAVEPIAQKTLNSVKKNIGLL
jgi:tryptophanyl-tRNA synthetase